MCVLWGGGQRGNEKRQQVTECDDRGLRKTAGGSHRRQRIVGDSRGRWGQHE